MKIALTGATGFIGRRLVKQLVTAGHHLKCLQRETSPVGLLREFREQIEWQVGELGDLESARQLVEGCDAAVHAGLWRSSLSFQSNEADLLKYAQVNLMGSLQLMDAAFAVGLQRFVFVSTCAVHDHILTDRVLDEKHPLWANSHYGAHKAALEKFVHSYGLGNGFPICAIRPSGVYGRHHPVERSKWFELIQQVQRGEEVAASRGGKEVHVDDVARAIEILLQAPEEQIRGQAFACYDRCISEFDVAQLTKQMIGSPSVIHGQPRQPRHQIVADKLKSLGMKFGGEARLRETIEELLS